MFLLWIIATVHPYQQLLKEGFQGRIPERLTNWKTFIIRIVELLTKYGRESIIETYIDLGADMDLHNDTSLDQEDVKADGSRVRNRFVDRVLQKSSQISATAKEQRINKSRKKKGLSKYVKRGEHINFLSESTELHLAILFFSIFALICTCVK